MLKHQTIIKIDISTTGRQHYAFVASMLGFAATIRTRTKYFILGSGSNLQALEENIHTKALVFNLGVANQVGGLIFSGGRESFR